MSLINDALKEAKAQSGHASLPPDLAEKIREGGGMPPDQDNGDSNDNAGNDSIKQKQALKKKRKGGTGDLAAFALIFLLLIGGLITAGYYLFPDLARKAGLDKDPDEQTPPPQGQPSGITIEPDEATAQSATAPLPDPDSSTEAVTEDTSPAVLEPAPETEPVPETVPKAPNDADAEPPEAPADNDAEVAPAPGTTKPQPVETAAVEPEFVNESTPETTKPQPAPPSMRRAFHLSAIVGTASRRMAVINGGIVQPGDTINDITIVSISRRRLVVEKDGNQYILRPTSAEK